MKRKITKIILASLIVLLIALISTLFMPFTRKESDKLNSYEYVIRDSISNRNAKIVDIAMLGAHDAFSSDISYNSIPNSNEEGIFNNKLVNTFGKGLVIRMSKAQIASAKELLYAGVRYFDVRITKLNGTYYTMHGYTSNTLESYLKDIVDFLSDHNGEFIIFDIQHFFTETGTNYELSKSDYEDLLNFMLNIKNDKGYSIIDYTNYDSSSPIGDLRYFNITNNGSTAGAIILASTDEFNCIYDRWHSIRSHWHETNSTKELLNGIENEFETLETATYYDDLLRVNQAQKTGFLMNASLIRSFNNWSLINFANDFNKILVSDEERFKRWLTNMPIIMVDYSTSKKGDFNTKANEYIIEYNKNL